MYCRPNSFAATRVVPLPQKKSAITSPSLDDAFIILSAKAFGFCVAYPTFSPWFLIIDICHQSSGILPSWLSSVLLPLPGLPLLYLAIVSSL